MKKFRMLTAVTLALLLVMATPLSAMAASWDVTDSQGVYDAFANDTDAEVIINMQNDINMDHYLTAGADQSYIINGNGNTISNVHLDGEGTVEINADINTEGYYVGIEVMENVDVTVNGDVTSEYSGLQIIDDASLTVNGNVTAEGGSGIYVDGGTVTVNGDVSAEYSGISASDGAMITVQGNVYAKEGNGIDIEDEGTSVNVTGDVTGGNYGMFVFDGAEASIEGDVTGKAGDGVYTIDGNVTVTGDVYGEYSGVCADQGASVTVVGDVTGESGTGINAWGESTTVTVTGDVSGENCGIWATEGATVTVEGNVASSDNSGIDAWGEGTNVDVNGDVTGTSGIIASEGAEVTVTGDVSAAPGADGYAGSGVSAMHDAVVTVNGNVTGANAVVTDEALLQDPTYGGYGSTGVYADDEAKVTVTGNVTGGNGAGTIGIGGDGVMAEGEAVVTVGGNVAGGDVIADPEVKAEGEEIVIDNEGNTETFYNRISNGGNGIYAGADATVAVGGDVTGGSTNADHGNGGTAIHLSDYDFAEGQLYEGTGKIDVKGTVTGGAAGAEGEGGAALYFESFYRFLPVGDIDFEEIMNTPIAQLTDEQIMAIDFMLNWLLNNGDLANEEVDRILEDVFADFTENTTDEEAMTLYYGALQDLLLSKDLDFDAFEENITSYGEITVGTLSDKNGPKLDSNAGRKAAEKYAKSVLKELVPTGDNPRTGDGFSGIFVVLMVASLLGLGVLLTQRKRFV